MNSSYSVVKRLTVINIVVFVLLALGFGWLYDGSGVELPSPVEQEVVLSSTLILSLHNATPFSIISPTKANDLGYTRIALRTPETVTSFECEDRDTNTVEPPDLRVCLERSIEQVSFGDDLTVKPHFVLTEMTQTTLDDSIGQGCSLIYPSFDHDTNLIVACQI